MGILGIRYFHFFSLTFKNNVFVKVCFLFLLQYFTGLECGHKFCMQCWSEYLTTKIMEEGMGQVT
jgi:hypothetical protein